MIKSFLHNTANAFVNSYAQLFFADHKVFAWLLLLSSYVNPITGLSGSLTAIFAIIFARWIGLNRTLLYAGTYSYNALMTGLVLGSQYDFNLPFVLILVCAAILSVFISVWFNSILYKYNLPSLSIGFLFTLWIITLSLRGFNQVEYNQQGLFRLNEWYELGGVQLVEWMQWMENNSLPEFLSVYLKSISAIFFQYNILSGALITIGLLIWSRIGFLLSLIGFAVGYIFYYSVSGEFTQLYYSYIGFNFILSAIAVGGFYLIPSRASFLLTIIIMPIIGILISGLNSFIYVWQLPLYSLPFVVTVILTLLLLNNRTIINRLIPVSLQLFTPEKNLYTHLNQSQRFKNNKAISLQLPFYGEWLVSQGYDGDITHKGEWKHALDFVVADETKHTYKLPGKSVTDFYCYGLPVLAPASGYVTTVIDGIDDNEVGDIDIRQNWGNVVVIKHADGFYSKLTHLKKDSITVRLNDYVSQGSIIGYCGSSGRSPEPHLHFQTQLTPFVGSATFPYPIAYYIRNNNGNYEFNEFSIPHESEFIHHPIKTPLLFDAFNFIPGQKLKFEVHNEKGESKIVVWECAVNTYNQTYLQCSETTSTAYFVNNGTVFYFTNYYGNKKSPLYQFYLAFHKILLGYYHHMEITDNLPITTFGYHPGLILHDFIAPFFTWMKVNYTSKFTYLDHALIPSEIHLESAISTAYGNRKSTITNYSIQIREQRIKAWKVISNNRTLFTFTCLEDSHS
ncbi:MAG: urea transporter [Bacteroidota bacterium]